MTGRRASAVAVAAAASCLVARQHAAAATAISSRGSNEVAGCLGDGVCWKAGISDVLTAGRSAYIILLLSFLQGSHGSKVRGREGKTGCGLHLLPGRWAAGC